ncbi:hypothetical protein [Microlunatus sp. GCM10028923]|uniref:hypothetical protein n=1 Tax=Microlunatus sp. GCM10028923 TaxID=3273400 RepID=UPI003670DDC1
MTADRSAQRLTRAVKSLGRRAAAVIEDKINNAFEVLRELLRLPGGRTPQPVRVRVRK